MSIKHLIIAAIVGFVLAAIDTWTYGFTTISNMAWFAKIGLGIFSLSFIGLIIKLIVDSLKK